VSEMLALCRAEAISELGSRGFEAEQTGLTYGVFVVRKQDQWYAYRNHCPHSGAPLDWMPHRFLDPASEFIQCSLHGALFRIEDGYCLRGPCVGRSLQPIGLRLEEGVLMLEGVERESASK
jgi:nitrite reductase/ring-hydroxylating ferredoxin subunit